jgi:tRNA(fMet)-specific endonuclease VapC
MILLDTDTLSLLLANHPRVVPRYEAAPEPVSTTIITRIELLEGRFAFLVKAEDGKNLLRAQEWLQRTENDLSRFPVVLIDDAVAATFDRLRKDRKLRKIGRKDLLIAAIALAHQALLVSRNQRDFREVPGLRLENWAD